MPKIKSVVWDPSGEQDHRVILLKVEEEGAICNSARKSTTDPFPCKLAALTPEARLFLQEQSVDLVKHQINLDYNYWTAGMQKWLTLDFQPTLLVVDDIINSILPEDLCDGSPTGFSITGHIGERVYVHPLHKYQSMVTSAHEPQ